MTRFFKFFRLILLIMLFVFTCIIWYLSPIYAPIPKLTGAYGVGLITKQFTDQTRTEIYSAKPHSKRTLAVDIYYPAAKSNQTYPFQPVMLNAIKQALAKNSYLPTFIWTCLLNNIKSYAKPNAPIISNKPNYPVILYLPGIGGHGLNSDLEEIASWGYIIAAIHPSYDISSVALPNGQTISLNPKLRDYVKNNDRKNIYAYRAQAHKIWLQDLEFVISELTKLNQDTRSEFNHKLNLNKLGILGVSHGGAVAIDFCRDNQICKAGINMDGWTKTANTNQGFDKAFLFLMSQDNIDKIEPLFNNMGPRAEKILVKNAHHENFTGPILKWPLPELLYGINSKDQLKIRAKILQHIRDFLNKYLQND